MMKLWSHANLNVKRKIVILNSCITSKVMYSLKSLWLLKADKDRLNAFQCWCLRRIMRIAPSFISRVSNADVYQRACQIQFSSVLECRQIQLYQKIQMMPLDAPIRKLICSVEGEPNTWFHHRCRGRPQQRWAASIHRLVVARRNIVRDVARPIRSSVPRISYVPYSTETWW